MGLLIPFNFQFSRKLKVCLFVVTALIIYYHYEQLYRFPFWWWFLHRHRRLCQSGTVPLLHDSKCYVTLKHGIVPFYIERVSKEPEVSIIRNFVDIPKRAKNLKRTIYTYGREAWVPNTILFHTEFENRIINRFKFRQSYMADFNRNFSSSIDWLFSRVESATGMDLRSSDSGGNAITGQYYPVNGHVVPHTDVTPKSDCPLLGRRFATVIVLLEPAREGGGTLMHNLGYRLDMNAGDALVFFNILPNDHETDGRVDHAGCPILEGRKTIITFWLRSHLQEFRKPCPMDNSVYSFL